MTPLFYILVGVLAWAFFSRYLKIAARLCVFLLSLILAYQIVLWVVPEIAAFDMRGILGGGALGLILALIAGGLWFYALGWRARVEATEAEDIERAKSKAAKDRKLA